MDDLILAAGIALCAGMLAFTLRQHRPLASLLDEGLLVGARAILWEHVQRVGYARGAQGSFFHIQTDDGPVGVWDEQLECHPEDLRRRLVERAGLVEVEPEHIPKHVLMLPGDTYSEWARPEAVAAAARKEADEQADERADEDAEWMAEAFGDDHAPSRPPRVPRPAAPAETAKKAAIGTAAGLALIWKFGKFALIGLQWLAKSLKLGAVWPTMLTMLASVWPTRNCGAGSSRSASSCCCSCTRPAMPS